jgi:3-phosphoshikimate 1-carboxyvinyltransferase
MATAGAILGLAVRGVAVQDIATTSKTMPDFPKLWADMLGQRTGAVTNTAMTNTAGTTGGTQH